MGSENLRSFVVLKEMGEPGSRRLAEIISMELPANHISNSSELSLCLPDSLSINGLVVDDVGTDKAKSRKSWSFWAACTMLYLCAFLSSVDATILSTALPQIAQDLKGTSILTFWCAMSFLLAKTVVQPGEIVHLLMSLIRSMGKHIRDFWSQRSAPDSNNCLLRRINSLWPQLIDGNGCCK
jgi:hypothetical protein